MEVKKIQGQDFEITTNQKRKNRKDYLYRVGKLKQNKILCDRNQNQNQTEYKDEDKKVSTGENCFESNQDDLDLQFHMPSVSSQIEDNGNKQNIENEHSAQQAPISQQKIEEKVVVLNNGVQESLSEVQDKEEDKNEGITIAQKLINFEDFDLDDPEPPLKRQRVENNDGVRKQEQGDESGSQEEIKGVSITSNSLEGNVVIKITNKKQLIFSRIPPGIILKCIIRRSTDIFNPEFDFYLHNGLKHVMSAKKYSLAKKQIYKLSMQLGQYKERDVIASIMANTVHSTYWIYKQSYLKQNMEYFIKGVVRYNKFVKNKERQMNVNLFVDKSIDIKVQGSRAGHEINCVGDLVLKNSCFAEKQNSCKNYSLCDQEDTEYEYLKMYKVSDLMFEVEIQHPLSPLQAFAISLTRFDAELK